MACNIDHSMEDVMNKLGLLFFCRRGECNEYEKDN